MNLSNQTFSGGVRYVLDDELAKIVRVIRKLDDSAPHDSVIVLDGTVGQNAMSQVKAFSAVADLSGLIVTKLDGSAKGGVVVALAEEFGLPVHAVGVGEGAGAHLGGEAQADSAACEAGVPEALEGGVVDGVRGEMKGDAERCLKAGMDAYLAKPLQPRELAAAIDASRASPPGNAVCGISRSGSVWASTST